MRSLVLVLSLIVFSSIVLADWQEDAALDDLNHDTLEKAIRMDDRSSGEKQSPEEETDSEGRTILRGSKARKAYDTWPYEKEIRQNDGDYGLVTLHIGKRKEDRFLCSRRSKGSLYDCVITPSEKKK